jgi:short-subunit dehydrogenase involved in D-alanine esterification of teichoic acids
MAIVTMITYFLPHLIKLGVRFQLPLCQLQYLNPACSLQSEGQHCFIVPITSGLGIVPVPWVLNYAATKAALHSFSMSLSAQLAATNVQVMEIMPPYVCFRHQ